MITNLGISFKITINIKIKFLTEHNLLIKYLRIMGSYGYPMMCQNMFSVDFYGFYSFKTKEDML